MSCPEHRHRGIDRTHTTPDKWGTNIVLHFPPASHENVHADHRRYLCRQQGRPGGLPVRHGARQRHLHGGFHSRQPRRGRRRRVRRSRHPELGVRPGEELGSERARDVSEGPSERTYDPMIVLTRVLNTNSPGSIMGLHRTAA